MRKPGHFKLCAKKQHINKTNPYKFEIGDNRGRENAINITKI